MGCRVLLQDSDEQEGSIGSSVHADGEIHDVWKPSSQPPPPVAENMQSTIKGQLKGACRLTYVVLSVRV